MPRIEGPYAITGYGCPYARKPRKFHIIKKTEIPFLLLDNAETINLDDFPDLDEFVHVQKYK